MCPLSSAKNGVCLCLGLEDFGRGQALLLFGYNARATGTIAEEPGPGSAPDNRFYGTGLLLYALRSSSSVPTISRRYRIAVLREHWHWSIISRSDGLGPWFSRS